MMNNEMIEILKKEWEAKLERIRAEREQKLTKEYVTYDGVVMTYKEFKEHKASDSKRDWR